jgi:hypothetical protein
MLVKMISILEGKIETAINMIKYGAEIDFISKVTGLTNQEILKIKANIS